MIVKHVRGDVLQYPVIAHQANCVSSSAKGFAGELFARYPWANLYRIRRPGHSIPGRAIFAEHDGVTVIHLLGQWCIGPHNKLNSLYARTDEERAIDETRDQRAEWFRQSLEALDKVGLKEDVAVPFKIGCNMGGGVWDDYRAMLEAASTRFVVVEKAAV